VGSCTAAGLSFTAVAGVGVCTSNHLACFVGDAVIWLGCKIVQQLAGMRQECVVWLMLVSF
jgi:hypothetical protein